MKEVRGLQMSKLNSRFPTILLIASLVLISSTSAAVEVKTFGVVSTEGLRKYTSGTVEADSRVAVGQDDRATGYNAFLRAYAIFDLRSLPKNSLVTDYVVSGITKDCTHALVDIEVDAPGLDETPYIGIVGGPLSVSRSNWDSAAPSVKWTQSFADDDGLCSWMGNNEGIIDDLYIHIENDRYSKIAAAAGTYLVFGFRGAWQSLDDVRISPSQESYSDDQRIFYGVGIQNLPGTDDDYIGTLSQFRLIVYYIVPPDTPTNVSASDGTYMAGIRITWDNVNDEEGYYVYRATIDSCISKVLSDA